MELQRFWVSWWSGNYESEGCTKPPFKFWGSGSRDRSNGKQGDDLSLCAVIDAKDEGAVWALVKRHFPDYEERFCEKKSANFVPDKGRFP